MTGTAWAAFFFLAAVGFAAGFDWAAFFFGATVVDAAFLEAAFVAAGLRAAFFVAAAGFLVVAFTALAFFGLGAADAFDFLLEDELARFADFAAPPDLVREAADFVRLVFAFAAFFVLRAM